MNAHAVFDLDGTLVDSAWVFAEILNAMLEERASERRVTAAQARRQVNRGGAGMVAELLGADCQDPDVEIAAFRSRYMQTTIPPSCLFPGVRDGLNALKRAGVRLSICSNKPQGLCEKTLTDLELLDLFDAIVGAGAGLPAKPHPAPFDKVLELTRGARSQSCFIGDEGVDHALALAVGVPFILADYGYAEPGATFDGALRAQSFAAVPGLVEQALRSARAWPARERFA